MKSVSSHGFISRRSNQKLTSFVPFTFSVRLASIVCVTIKVSFKNSLIYFPRTKAVKVL